MAGGVSFAPIADVRRKTKRYKFKAMARALARMGIPFTPAADGEPLVRQEDLDGTPRRARNDGPRFHLIHR